MCIAVSLLHLSPMKFIKVEFLAKMCRRASAQIRSKGAPIKMCWRASDQGRIPGFQQWCGAHPLSKGRARELQQRCAIHHIFLNRNLICFVNKTSALPSFISSRYIQWICQINLNIHVWGEFNNICWLIYFWNCLV